MAIILRDTTSNNTGKGSELTYLEMDTNLESFYFSSSLSGTDLVLYTTGSDTHSIDLSGITGLGAQGTQGIQGIQGTDGIDGIDGAQGTQGIAGTASAQGAQGIQGIQGLEGIDGAQGTQGIAGTASAQGAQGTQGIQGLEGAQGLTGTGAQGVQGVQGPSGAGSVENIYNTDGTLTGNRTVTADGNNIVFDFGDGDFTVQSGGNFGGGVFITDLVQASGSSFLAINPVTGQVSHMLTSSFTGGGTATPGGSNTQVQFNENGGFGGDANFTWNSGSNYLTLKGDISAPGLRLVNSIPGNFSGVTLGYISAYEETFASASVGGIRIVSENTFSNGDVPTRFEILTTPDGTETPTVKLTVKNDGKLVASQYGSGTFTGTVAKYLAVDSSGTVIETALDTGSLENPSIGRDAGNSVTNVVFDVNIATADANWTLEAVTVGGTPSGAGKARISNSSPASATQFSVWKTANSSVDMSSPLEQLAPGSIITLTAVGANTATGTYRVTAKSLSTNAVTYTISYIEGAANTFAIGATFTIDTVEGVFEYDLAPGYNYLNIRNNGSASDRLRLRYEAATGEFPDGGGYIPVQILCNGSGQGYSLDYIADNKTYQWSLTGFTGTWSSTNPVIGFITNDFKPGDRFISSFLVWGEGNNEGIVPQNWTVYQSDTALEPSDRTVPTQYYQNTFDTSERITTTTIPNLYELNGGTINIDPQGGTSDALIIGLGGLLTDYSTAVNNVNGANLVQLNIVTPTAKNGWSIYWLGYRSSTNERYRVVNTSINGGTGTNSPVKLDWSGRAEISVDFSESKIFVWSSNWEN